MKAGYSIYAYYLTTLEWDRRIDFKVTFGHAENLQVIMYMYRALSRFQANRDSFSKTNAEMKWITYEKALKLRITFLNLDKKKKEFGKWVYTYELAL